MEHSCQKKEGETRALSRRRVGPAARKRLDSCCVKAAEYTQQKTPGAPPLFFPLFFFQL